MNKKEYIYPSLHIEFIGYDDIILTSNVEIGGILDLDGGPFEEV